VAPDDTAPSIDATYRNRLLSHQETEDLDKLIQGICPPAKASSVLPVRMEDPKTLH